jgi:S1-C subfamily serine protease
MVRRRRNIMKNMKKFMLVVMCAVMMVVLAGCTIGAGPNRQDLTAMIEASYTNVVSIETFKTATATRHQRQSMGSGVLVHSGSDFSVLATNVHVISDRDGKLFPYIDVINWSTGLMHGDYDTRVVAALKDYTTRVNIATAAGAPLNNVAINVVEDLAIIKFTIDHDNAVAYKNSAATVRETPLRVGEPIAAMGYSFGEFHRVSIGSVSQVFPTRTFFDGKEERILTNAFMHDATTIFGNSGGPVFDAAGRVVGLSTMTVMMCSTSCKFDPHPTNPALTIPHDCDVAALGFSIALSSISIATMLKNAPTAWGLVV